MWHCVYFADEPVYKAVGQKVVLTPDSGADPITSVTWKYGLDIAMAWHGGETDAYRHFKGAFRHIHLRFNSTAEKLRCWNFV